MKVILSTDAHHPEHLKLMRYGVTTARRGGLTKQDVLNTLPPAKLLAALRPPPSQRRIPGSTFPNPPPAAPW